MSRQKQSPQAAKRDTEKFLNTIDDSIGQLVLHTGADTDDVAMLAARLIWKLNEDANALRETWNDKHPNDKIAPPEHSRIGAKG